MSDARRAMLLMIAFAASWAIVELLAPHVSAGFPVYQVVWSRYAVHLAFMLVVWGWREPGSLWRTRRPVYQFARSLLMLGMPAAYITSLQRGVDPGVLLSVLWTCPLLMLIIARLVLGERAPAGAWLATMGACAGAVLTVARGPLPPPILLIYPVATAATFSTYVVMTRSLRSETTRANLFYTALGVFIPLSFYMPHVWVVPTVHDVVVLTGVGLIGFAGLLAVDHATALAPVSVSGPVTPFQPVFMTVLAAALGYQHAGKRFAAAATMVMIAAIYLWARQPLLPIREAASA